MRTNAISRNAQMMALAVSLERHNTIKILSKK